MVVSESARKSTGFIRGDDAGLLHSNRQRFYQNMLVRNIYDFWNIQVLRMYSDISL